MLVKEVVMKKKIFVSEDDDDSPWSLVTWKYEDPILATTPYCCTKKEWAIYKLFEKLVDQGADEKLLEEFQSAVYQEARESTELDFAERED
jgi:hypothetical protein